VKSFKPTRAGADKWSVSAATDTRSRSFGGALKSNPVRPSQLEHEIWLELDGRRVLARLRAAGPSWIHVYIEGDTPSDAQVAFTVVLRGGDGGVIEGLGYMMSSSNRDERTVLHVRITELTTAGCQSLLRRFARDILNDEESKLVGRGAAPRSRLRSQRGLGARHDTYGSMPVAHDASVPEDSIVVSKPVLWRSGSLTSASQLVRTSVGGRRLLIRLQGSVPEAWETVKLELDLGSCGEPRPVQLVAMVLGTVDSRQGGICHVVVRLVRGSLEADRVVWMRWVNHQQRLNTVLNLGLQSAPAVTRNLSALVLCGGSI
jgi:hypothetical protein